MKVVSRKMTPFYLHFNVFLTPLSFSLGFFSWIILLFLENMLNILIVWCEYLKKWWPWFCIILTMSLNFYILLMKTLMDHLLVVARRNAKEVIFRLKVCRGFEWFVILVFFLKLNAPFLRVDGSNPAGARFF